jgi:hypothetical protein
MRQYELKVWSFYVRKRVAYISHTAKTAAGFFVNVEPTHVVAVSDTEELTCALRNVLSHGNPSVPTPAQSEYVKPFVLAHAKVKSWTTFQKESQSWKIVVQNGTYRIQQMRLRSDARGFEDDPSKIETMIAWPTLDEVAKRATVLVQAANPETR